MYFFVPVPPLIMRTSIPAFWATSVNRIKGLDGRGAPEKLGITKTQAAKSNPAKPKLRFRDTPAHCTRVKREKLQAGNCSMMHQRGLTRRTCRAYCPVRPRYSCCTEGTRRIK